MSEVICHHCKQPIESKGDLLVMLKWWFLPRPLHKQCWGDLYLSKGGAGTISFGTGVFQNRRQPKIAVNSLLFSILAFLALIFAFIVLIFIDFSAGTWTVNGVERAPTILEAWGLKSILFFLLLIPMIQRMWSYNAIEKKIGAAN